MIELPRLPEPRRYAGLYVFDFGDHVCAGYTAEEIAILLNQEAYRNCAAYRIHRVDREGRIELSGITARHLSGEDILVFANRRAEQAGEDFSTLRKLASRTPPPCDAALELVDIPGFDPPHAVCLIYPHHASNSVSDWLSAIEFSGGDFVSGGSQTLNEYRASVAEPIARAHLPGRMEFAPRSPQEVLGSVDQPLQR